MKHITTAPERRPRQHRNVPPMVLNWVLLLLLCRCHRCQFDHYVESMNKNSKLWFEITEPESSNWIELRANNNLQTRELFIGLSSWMQYYKWLHVNSVLHWLNIFTRHNNASTRNLVSSSQKTSNISEKIVCNYTQKQKWCTGWRVGSCKFEIEIWNVWCYC